MPIFLYLVLIWNFKRYGYDEVGHFLYARCIYLLGLVPVLLPRPSVCRRSRNPGTPHSLVFGDRGWHFVGLASRCLDQVGRESAEGLGTFYAISPLNRLQLGRVCLRHRE